MQVEDIKNALLNIPQEIRDKQQEVLDLTEKLNRETEEVARLEANIKTDVQNEVDDNGKKVYSNAESRDIEFRRRSDEDPLLKGAKDTLTTTNRDLQEKRFDIELLHNKQRNYRSVVGIVDMPLHS